MDPSLNAQNPFIAIITKNQFDFLDHNPFFVYNFDIVYKLIVRLKPRFVNFNIK